MIGVGEICPTCGRGLLLDRDTIPTRQQVRILRLLADGLTAYEVAAELWLNIETVRWHIKRAYRRLGVHSRTEAIDRARELGLLAPASPEREGLA